MRSLYRIRISLFALFIALSIYGIFFFNTDVATFDVPKFLNEARPFSRIITNDYDQQLLFFDVSSQYNADQMQYYLEDRVSTKKKEKDDEAERKLAQEQLEKLAILRTYEEVELPSPLVAAQPLPYYQHGRGAFLHQKLNFHYYFYTPPAEQAQESVNSHHYQYGRVTFYNPRFNNHQLLYIQRVTGNLLPQWGTVTYLPCALASDALQAPLTQDFYAALQLLAVPANEALVTTTWAAANTRMFAAWEKAQWDRRKGQRTSMLTFHKKRGDGSAKSKDVAAGTTTTDKERKLTEAEKAAKEERALEAQVDLSTVPIYDAYGTDQLFVARPAAVERLRASRAAYGLPSMVGESDVQSWLWDSVKRVRFAAVPQDTAAAGSSPSYVRLDHRYVFDLMGKERAKRWKFFYPPASEVPTVRSPRFHWRHFYFAINLFKNDNLIPFLTGALLHFFQYELFPRFPPTKENGFYRIQDHVVVSIYLNEDASGTGFLVQHLLLPYLRKIGLRHLYFTAGGSCYKLSKRPKKMDRIEWLSCVRNKAMEPLYERGMSLFPATSGEGKEVPLLDGTDLVVIFMNDIFFRPVDIINLLESRPDEKFYNAIPHVYGVVKQVGREEDKEEAAIPGAEEEDAEDDDRTEVLDMEGFDMACGLDYYETLYDLWVMRPYHGSYMIPVPPYVGPLPKLAKGERPPDFAADPSRDQYNVPFEAAGQAAMRRLFFQPDGEDGNRALPVKSCWNGMAAIRGSFFVPQKMNLPVKYHRYFTSPASSAAAQKNKKKKEEKEQEEAAKTEAGVQDRVLDYVVRSFGEESAVDLDELYFIQPDNGTTPRVNTAGHYRKRHIPRTFAAESYVSFLTSSGHVAGINTTAEEAPLAGLKTATVDQYNSALLRSIRAQLQHLQQKMRAAEGTSNAAPLLLRKRSGALYEPVRVFETDRRQPKRHNGTAHGTASFLSYLQSYYLRVLLQRLHYARLEMLATKEPSGLYNQDLANDFPRRRSGFQFYSEFRPSDTIHELKVDEKENKLLLTELTALLETYQRSSVSVRCNGITSEHVYRYFFEHTNPFFSGRVKVHRRRRREDTNRKNGDGLIASSGSTKGDKEDSRFHFLKPMSDRWFYIAEYYALLYRPRKATFASKELYMAQLCDAIRSDQKREAKSLLEGTSPLLDTRLLRGEKEKEEEEEEEQVDGGNSSEGMRFYKSLQPIIQFRHSVQPSFAAINQLYNQITITPEQRYEDDGEKDILDFAVRQDVCTSSECLLLGEDILHYYLLLNQYIHRRKQKARWQQTNGSAARQRTAPVMRVTVRNNKDGVLLPVMLINPKVKVAYDEDVFERLHYVADYEAGQLSNSAETFNRNIHYGNRSRLRQYLYYKQFQFFDSPFVYDYVWTPVWTHFARLTCRLHTMGIGLYTFLLRQLRDLLLARMGLRRADNDDGAPPVYEIAFRDVDLTNDYYAPQDDPMLLTLKSFPARRTGAAHARYQLNMTLYSSMRCHAGDSVLSVELMIPFFYHTLQPIVYVILVYVWLRRIHAVVAMRVTQSETALLQRRLAALEEGSDSRTRRLVQHRYDDDDGTALAPDETLWYAVVSGRVLPLWYVVSGRVYYLLRKLTFTGKCVVREAVAKVRPHEPSRRSRGMSPTTSNVSDYINDVVVTKENENIKRRINVDAGPLK